MFVIPISPTLLSNPEQNVPKAKKNFSFGLRLSENAEAFVSNLEKSSPENNMLLVVINNLRHRVFDGLLLDIDAIDPKKLWVSIYNENLKVDGRMQSIYKWCSNGKEVVDAALGFLTKEDGKPKPALVILNQIFEATESRLNGLLPIKSTASASVAPPITPAPIYLVAKSS